MKKTLTALLLLLGPLMALAQKDSVYYAKSFYDTNAPDSVYRHLPCFKENVPSYIINSQIISNLNCITPNNIIGIVVVTNDSTLSSSFRNLNKYGLISINLKAGTKLKTKSFKQIKKSLSIKGPVKYAVDGFFIDDENILITTDSILGLDIMLNKYNDAKAGATLNIWTMTPDNRKGLKRVKLATDKPGVMYIR